MHTYVKALTKIASRYAPSRILSFELVHIFKAIGAWGRFCKNISETFEDAEPSKIYKWWNSINRKRKGTVIGTATINSIRS